MAAPSLELKGQSRDSGVKGGKKTAPSSILISPLPHSLPGMQTEKRPLGQPLCSSQKVDKTDTICPLCLHTDSVKYTLLCCVSMVGSHPGLIFLL